jgi:hypothetical protein
LRSSVTATDPSDALRTTIFGAAFGALVGLVVGSIAGYHMNFDKGGFVGALVGGVIGARMGRAGLFGGRVGMVIQLGAWVVAGLLLLTFMVMTLVTMWGIAVMTRD